MITAYKHILWDWNGTLLDDVWLSVETMNGVLAKRGLKALTMEGYLEVFGFPVKDYYAKIGLDFSQEPFETLSEEFITAYDCNCFRCSLKEQAKPLLDAIAGRGISQSILSAAHLSYLHNCMKHYGIGEYFQHIAGLEDIHAFSKVQASLNLINRLGMDPQSIVLVGDTVHDFEVASSIGCSCILVADGHQRRERLEACNVPVVDHLSDLLELIG